MRRPAVLKLAAQDNNNIINAFAECCREDKSMALRLLTARKTFKQKRSGMEILPIPLALDCHTHIATLDKELLPDEFQYGKFVA